MKKSLLQLAGCLVISVLLGGVVKAELDISDLFTNGTPLVTDAYAKVLNDYDNTRGYSNSIMTLCDSKGEGSVSITSPSLEDSQFYKIKSYRLFLSPYRVDKLKSGDLSVDTSKIIIKEVNIKDDDSEVNFLVSSSDIDSSTAYYGFILPIDMYDGVGAPSKEICLQLDKNVCMLDSECDTFDLVINPAQATETENAELGDSHGAASCVGMKMANVSHTWNGDTVTLKWTAVDGDVVEIGIFDPESEQYKNLGAVNMKDEKFDYKIQRDGEQNFLLTNGCGELRYKADAGAGEPEKIVTPATGPAQNILYIAIAAIVLYGAYTIFSRKSSNN